MKIYNAKILYGEDFELIEGSLEIKNGSISKIREGNATGDFNAKGSIVIPSFINAHVHLLDALGKDMWYGKTLDELVRPPNSLKHKLLKKPESKIKSAANAAVKEMLMSGTTYYCEFSNIPKISTEILKISRMDGKILYEPIEVMDDNEVWENILDNALVKNILKVASECEGLGISGVCEFSDAILQKLASLSKYFALHAAEHKISQERSIRQTGRTEIERAVKIKPKFLVHLTHPLKNDLILLEKNKIPVICCPRANAVLNVGSPPIPQLLRNKVLVALGTDNVMLNSPDILRELEFVAKLWPELEPQTILKLVTVNPAKIFGLNKGVAQEGKDADLILLKPLENLEYSHDIVASIIHRATQRNIWKVYYKGRAIYG
ncbi:MAG: amidohydrolase family protein [Candidatus Thermoplasmatota archaeon]|nr:amidohydrolase family protein [Candidatus Thermoplasmatota archaeon]